MSLEPRSEIHDATLRTKIMAAAALLERIANEYTPAALASSLGLEDMVLTDLIRRDERPIEIFSIDTGRLPAQTYELMQEIKQHYGFKLKVYFPKAELIEPYVREHGINAFYESVELRKQCCQLRKVEPLQRALAGKRAWITGLRAEQSVTRVGLPVQQFDETNGLEKFNPLVHWTTDEVWAYVRARGVPYNRLHDQLYPSIGCAPCTRAVSAGEDLRSGRWWWENPDVKECGLHLRRRR